MTRALHSQGEAGNTAVTVANTTEYWNIGMGGGNLTSYSAVEADHQVLCKNTGILSDLTFSIRTNTISGGSSTVLLRKNGVAGNMTISIPASATGNFALASPATTTDSIAPGDLICLRITPGATTGVITFQTMGTTFLNTANSDTITRLGIGGFPVGTYNTASATLYEPIAGEMQGTDQTVETTAKCRIRKPGTVKNAAIYVQANARSTSETYTIRKNAASSGLTISVGAALTGWFEDTTHTTSVIAGDDINWQIVIGTGTGTFKVTSMLCDFVTTDGWFPVITACADTGSQAAATTAWCPIGGYRFNNATESNIDAGASSNFTFAELTANVTTNGIAAVSTITVRKGLANTALTVSTTASTTALLNDSTHSFTTIPTDRLDHQIATGGASGNMYAASIIIWGQEIIQTVPQTVFVEWEEA